MTPHAPHRRPHPARSHRAVLGAIVTAGVFLLGACGDDDGGSLFGEDDERADDGEDEGRDDGVVERDEFGVGLYNAGGGSDEDDGDDGDRVLLPPPYEAGQSATTTVSMQMEFDVDAGPASADIALGIELAMSQAIVDVTDDVATVEMSIDTVDVVDAPPEVSQADIDAEFGPVIGQVVVARYSQSGVQIGDIELKDGGALPDSLSDAFDSATDVGVFPTEPVGVGARWSSLDDLDFEGASVQGETFYELVELTDAEYVLEITQDVPLDTTIEGAAITGGFTATGELRGSRDNPLLLTMTYAQDGSFDISEGSESGSMTTHIELEMISD